MHIMFWNKTKAVTQSIDIDIGSIDTFIDTDTVMPLVLLVATAVSLLGAHQTLQ
jgi:hypothetical protein